MSRLDQGTDQAALQAQQHAKFLEYVERCAEQHAVADMYELTTSALSIHYSDRYADEDYEYRLVTMLLIKPLSRSSTQGSSSDMLSCPSHCLR